MTTEQLQQLDMEPLAPPFKERPNIHYQFFNRSLTSGENNFQVSKTQPDQSMTVRELLMRNARGLPLSGNAHPLYQGDEEYFPDLKKLDLSEIAALRDEVQTSIEKHRAEIAEQNKEIAKQEAERAKLEMFRQWKEEEEQKSKKPII
jgi:hypothetical protein